VIVLDVNVLVASFRQDHAHHPAARPWLDCLITSAETIVVPDIAWVGFVRIVSNSHIFEIPSSPAEAFEFVGALCSAPNYLQLAGLTDSIGPFETITRESDSWGNLVPDAYLAAIALTNAAILASFDRDFRRFDGLEIVVPAA
jgi:toxin-antitoxin system PIN domain toxin